MRFYLMNETDNPLLTCVCAGHTFTEILTFRPPKDPRETSL